VKRIPVALDSGTLETLLIMDPMDRSSACIPAALTIAGSDSGGGAGIQADIKTFQAFGVFATTALTAVTAQNTLGVASVHQVPVDVVGKQIDLVVADLGPQAVKSGMLATAEIVACVAERIAKHELSSCYVLDPVMVATSGDRLLAREAERKIAAELLPLACLVTPNAREASVLTGMTVHSAREMRGAAKVLVEMGAGAVLVTGGHLEGKVSDIYWDGVEERVWQRPRIGRGEYHGTGCTLSAAIASGLAYGHRLTDCIDKAIGYVERALVLAPSLGSGHSPLNHWGR